MKNALHSSLEIRSTSYYIGVIVIFKLKLHFDKEFSFCEALIPEVNMIQRKLLLKGGEWGEKQRVEVFVYVAPLTPTPSGRSWINKILFMEWRIVEIVANA